VSRFSISGTGRMLAVTAVAVYAAGVLLGYDLLVTLAVGALTVLAAGAVTVSIRPAVTVIRDISPDRTTVGEPALGRVEVRNPSRWPVAGFTAVDRVGVDQAELTVGPLRAGARRTLHYPVPALRRGRMRVGPLTVERRDPFGLFRWARRTAGDAVLWIHPRVHPLRPLPVGTVPDYEGRTTENARAGTVTFSSLREYVPGDDPRQIHWRSTARTGTLIVRDHVDTTEPSATVVLDTRAVALSPDAFEHAAEVAASVLRTVEDAGRPASLHIVGEDAADAVTAGAMSTLDRLALAGRLDTADPVPLLAALDRATPGGALVVVTGDADEAMLARLAEQRRRFAPVVVVALLAAERADAGGIRRRPGMAVLIATTAEEAAGAWNRMTGGESG